MEKERLDIEKALEAVGEILESKNEVVGIVVLGGTALNLLGMVTRTTSDVDVVAIGMPPPASMALRPPDPLPLPLTQAIKKAARDFGLSADWMNTVAGSQWHTGLPPGLENRLQWRQYGGLHVGLVSRYDLIFFKLYAAVDSSGPGSVHYQDLVALSPSRQELEDAANWIRTQDVSPEFTQLLDQVLARIHQDVE